MQEAFYASTWTGKTIPSVVISSRWEQPPERWFPLAKYFVAPSWRTPWDFAWRKTILQAIRPQFQRMSMSRVRCANRPRFFKSNCSITSSWATRNRTR